MLIHLHIPKTGGTSLVDLLKRQYGAGFYRVNNQLANDPLWAQPSALQSFQCVSGHFAFGLHRRVDLDARYITFVREPVERLLSFYHYVTERSKSHPYKRVIRKMSFAEFATCDRPWSFLDNDMVRRVAGVTERKSFRPVTDDDLGQAIANLQHFAPVGLTDRFDASILRWALEFGWRAPEYTLMLAQPDRTKREDLPGDLIAEIEQRQRFDLMLYHFVLKRDW